MGFRPIEKFASLTPVAANGKATADLPASGSYYSILLHCITPSGGNATKANMLTAIRNVKITLDGTTVYELNGAGVQKLYEHHYAQHNGAAIFDGMLPIMLSPDHLTNNMDAEKTAWGMSDVGVIQVEVDFGSNIGGAGQTSAVDVYVERTQVERPLGLHRRIQRYERSFTSSGRQEITDLVIEPGADVVTAAYHILYHGGNAVINECEVIANNQTVMTLVPVVHRMQLEKRGRRDMTVAAANSLFTIPFDLSNDMFGYLSHERLNDLRLRIDWSASPGSYTLIRESYHGVMSGG